MSGYNNGRRISQYLRDLNTISPQDTTGDDHFNMGEELALFTNTEFYDFDSGQHTDFQPPPVKVDTSAAPSVAEDPASASVTGDMSAIDFVHSDYPFAEFGGSNYQQPSMNSFTPDGSHTFQSLQPNHNSVYPNPVPAPQHPQYAHAPAPRGEKRKDDSDESPNGSGSLEDSSRAAAEEDKRRRNTAASARFRIKKKQREQALERSAKEMTEKVSSLESKVSQLETENKWLKNLLVDKSGGNEDIANLWKEFTKHASKMANKSDAGKEDR